MKQWIGKLGGRKFIGLILDLAFCGFVAVGMDISDELKIQIIKWVNIGYGAFVGSTGIADGLSNGKTSTTAAVK